MSPPDQVRLRYPWQRRGAYCSLGAAAMSTILYSRRYCTGTKSSSPLPGPRRTSHEALAPSAPGVNRPAARERRSRSEDRQPLYTVRRNNARRETMPVWHMPTSRRSAAWRTGAAGRLGEPVGERRGRQRAYIDNQIHRSMCLSLRSGKLGIAGTGAQRPERPPQLRHGRSEKPSCVYEWRLQCG